MQNLTTPNGLRVGLPKHNGSERDEYGRREFAYPLLDGTTVVTYAIVMALGTCDAIDQLEALYADDYKSVADLAADCNAILGWKPRA